MTLSQGLQMKKETEGAQGPAALSGFKSSSSHLAKAKDKPDASYELPLKTFLLDNSKSTSFSSAVAPANKFLQGKIKPGSVRPGSVKNVRANGRRTTSSHGKDHQEYTFKPQTNDLMKSPFLAPVVSNLAGSIHRTVQMPKFIDSHFKQRLLMQKQK